MFKDLLDNGTVEPKLDDILQKDPEQVRSYVSSLLLKLLLRAGFGFLF